MQKAIFITGGGSGIGRATAQHFASRGWFVGLADVNASGLAETAALLPNTMSSMHVMDVRDRAAWQSALADFVTHTGGRLDVLFNNAGIGTGGPLEAMDPKDVERVLDINLKGVFWGAQIGFEYLKNTPGSALVSTSRNRLNETGKAEHALLNTPATRSENAERKRKYEAKCKCGTGDQYM